MSDAKTRARTKLLKAFDELRQQIESDQVHTVGWVACDDTGTHVVTGLVNGALKPVTLLGATSVLNHRLIEVINLLDEATEPVSDGPPSDEPMN